LREAIVQAIHVEARVLLQSVRAKIVQKNFAYGSDGECSATIQAAIVDMTDLGLGLPASIIDQLRLLPRQENRVRGKSWCDPVNITIGDRQCVTDVWMAPVESVPVIGHTVLTLLDLVVDLHDRNLIGNPAHGGEHILELY
jgi:hypothetical protein